RRPALAVAVAPPLRGGRLHRGLAEHAAQLDLGALRPLLQARPGGPLSPRRAGQVAGEGHVPGARPADRCVTEPNSTRGTMCDHLSGDITDQMVPCGPGGAARLVFTVSVADEAADGKPSGDAPGGHHDVHVVLDLDPDGGGLVRALRDLARLGASFDDLDHILPLDTDCPSFVGCRVEVRRSGRGGDGVLVWPGEDY